MGPSVDPAFRLVTFGNAFLAGRYDRRREINAAVATGVRVRFDTWFERRRGILPIRRVASNPYAWFRWLRHNGFRRLVLVYLEASDIAQLDGPLKVFGATSRGWAVAAERPGLLPVLWGEWVRGRAGMFATGAYRVEYRGAEAYRVPAPASLDLAEVAARLDDLLAAAPTLEPGDTTMLERARADLHAAAPEDAAPLLAWPPVSCPPPVRRLIAALEFIGKADDAHSNWDGPPARPPGFREAVVDAILVAANSS